MPRLNASITDRIRAASIVLDAGCWVWARRRDRHGYGHIKIGGRSILAHRASYEAFVGAIPAGLTIDHLCANTLCVNPAHLEPVTMRANILRSNGITAVAARKTHCVRGHELAGENLYRSSTGKRHCRACNCLRTLAYKRRKGGHP